MTPPEVTAADREAARLWLIQHITPQSDYAQTVEMLANAFATARAERADEHARLKARLRATERDAAQLLDQRDALQARVTALERELADAHGIAQALERWYIERKARIAALEAAVQRAHEAQEVLIRCFWYPEIRVSERTAIEAARQAMAEALAPDAGGTA
jgi:septal ring factor EnvC (AmiA/AmiB activator)